MVVNVHTSVINDNFPGMAIIEHRISLIAHVFIVLHLYATQAEREEFNGYCFKSLRFTVYFFVIMFADREVYLLLINDHSSKKASLIESTWQDHMETLYIQCSLPQLIINAC